MGCHWRAEWRALERRVRRVASIRPAATIEYVRSHGEQQAERGERYEVWQVYALAAGGAEGARTVHVFLEAPDDPVTEEFGSERLAAARERLTAMPAAIPARLEGWARGWTQGRDNAASEKTFARPDGSLPRFCLGLNLDPDPAAPAPNGVLIEVSEAKLDRLDVREIRYRRVEVTEAVVAPHGPVFDRVIIYVTRPEHRHPTPPDDAIVISTYPATIEAAFDRLGPGQLELFRSTTAPIPVELTEAILVADRIPPGNPRQW